MTWHQRYRFRQYVADSIWILPLGGIAAALFAARIIDYFESTSGWALAIRPETAWTILAAMASSMFTLVVFVCSALLVAVQLASGQLTPRVIAVLFRDRITKYSLTIFVFAFTFTLTVLVRTGAAVPPFAAYFAAYTCLASLAIFLYLIDHIGKALRPSGVLSAVAAIGREVIVDVYPKRLSGNGVRSVQEADEPRGESPLTVRSLRDGFLLAADLKGLAALARHADCVVELVPEIGDFVAAGDPLFRISPSGTSVSVGELVRSVVLGQERTMVQDPAFVFRIMVDIASKALSPAINDPTTAVLAIDQIHHLLRVVGARDLEDGRVRDTEGHVRLIYRTPDWEDFVYLAVTEIRQFGGGSIQVARRLRAMLENLISTLPEERTPLLRKELDLLHRISMRFAEPEDRALADVADLQGMGGKYEADQRRRDMAADRLSDALPPVSSVAGRVE